MSGLDLIEGDLLSLIHTPPKIIGNLTSGILFTLIERNYSHCSEKTQNYLPSLSYTSIIQKLRRLKSMGLIDKKKKENNWYLTSEGKIVCDDLFLQTSHTDTYLKPHIVPMTNTIQKTPSHEENPSQSTMDELKESLNDTISTSKLSLSPSQISSIISKILTHLPALTNEGISIFIVEASNYSIPKEKQEFIGPLAGKLLEQCQSFQV